MSQKIKNASLMGAAYHEAGHAVIAAMLELPIEKVSILAGEESCDLGSMPEPLSRPEIEHLIMFYLAGITAQFLSGTKYCRTGHSAYDDKETVRLLRGLECQRPLEVLEELREGTYDLVTNHMPAIMRVAQELLRTKELSGEEIRRVLSADATTQI